MQRYALRTLRQSPWYSAMVISVLGVGMALATVVFAVVDGVLFKPLPTGAWRNCGRRRSRQRADLVRSPRVTARSRRGRGDTRLPLTAVSSPYRFRRTDGRDTGRPRSTSVLRRPGGPAVVRRIRSEDFDWWEPQGPAVRPLLVSYRFWHQELGGAPDAVGRSTSGSGRRPVGRTDRRRVAAGFRVSSGSDEPQPESCRRCGGFAVRSGPIIVSCSACPRVRSRLRSRPAGGCHTSCCPRRIAAGHQPRHLSIPCGWCRRPMSSGAATSGLRAHARGAAVLLLLACLNVAGLTAARNVERRRMLAVWRALGADRQRVCSKPALGDWTARDRVGRRLALLLAKPLLVWTISLLPATVVLLKTPALDVRVMWPWSFARLRAVMAWSALWPARVDAR